MNKHLNKLNLEVTELETQVRDASDIHVYDRISKSAQFYFHIHNPIRCTCVVLILDICVQFADGVYLVLLMGLLEDYFVPLYNFFLTPESFEQKVMTPSKWNLIGQIGRFQATYQ